MCKGSSLLMMMCGVMIGMVSWSMRGLAQDEKHFVYIQSDQHQLFYVKLNDQIISANPPGYVVLSPVQPGRLDLIIGFPRNTYPEQRYQINIPAHQDKGYLLKRINDREFALYDLHQYTELRPVAVAEGQGFAYPQPARKDTPISPESKLQAKAPGPVKDTTPDAEQIRFRQLLMAAATAGQPGESVSVAHTRKPDSAANTSVEASTSVIDTNARQPSHEVAKAIYPPVASQASDTLMAAEPTIATDTAAQAVLAIHPDTSMESILQKLRRLAEQTPAAQRPDTFTSSTIAAVAEPVSQNNNPSTPAMQPANSNSPALRFIHFDTTAQQQASTQHITMINSDCEGVINEKQFDEIKNKVAAQRSDAAMLRVIQRNLKNNCFTTHQVEMLVYLFTTESYRYRFVEWVYPHVTDSDQFKQLGHVFTDEAYQARFRSLIRQ
ncbi:MAG: DUF4476 domain-containing protein [Thermoflavifilum sp.]|uniref:DUF4476 domain-containing protein n=1 Tax=Thermoflavifilum sp. TaxID=1968839 RepID=UPI0018A4A4AD|nr:DUF4476 domain-containing protein [Thermoflavifilum sp.]QOR76321.1 MAG: DUF4476 domain-containing protein [Thermoflavifilum sp.]